MRFDDRGDIVAGWLVKLAVVMGVLGILLFDVVALGLGRVNAADDASNAAQMASEAYFASRGNVNRAYAAAVDYAADHSATVPVDSFFVHPDGTVELKVIKSVKTIVIKHVGPLRKLTKVTEAAKAKSLPS